MARASISGGRRPRSLRAGIFSALATIAVALLLAGGVGLWVLGAKGPGASPVTAVLAKGSGITEIGAALQRSGAIRSGAVFAAAAEITGAARQLKAGEYEFPARVSLSEVLRKLRAGEVVHHHVTIPEGLTSQQAVDILNKTDVLTGAVPTPAEGALLPETYDVVRGEDRAAVLRRMMAARDKLLIDLWSRRQAGLPLATVDEAVTLASIVEKETAVPAERPKVAAVYVNRLRRSMRLEADPTLVYGITGGQPMGRGLLESELLTPGPYNTYLNVGLPPTPIGNPGRASLAAVLDPPATEDIFFVADGTGGHAFASSYEAHVRNVDHWRQIERMRKTQAGLLKPAPPKVDPPKARKVHKP
ncbi:MAG: endolytic transglycosylase MltG [Caulobacteraceae bacterium]